MSRSVILGRIRRATLGADSPGLPERLPAFPQFADPVSPFQKELELAGGVFLDGSDPVKLADSLGRVLEDSESREIFWESEQVLKKHEIPYHLRDPLAFEQRHLVWSAHLRMPVTFPLVLHGKGNRRRHLPTVTLSASTALWGIADTGTTVHQVRPGQGRLLSILPPCHVVLLRRQDLLMNSAELFSRLGSSDDSSLTTLMTGPSRTADIEKTLVMGVHGPQKWFVVLTG